LVSCGAFVQLERVIK